MCKNSHTHNMSLVCAPPHMNTVLGLGCMAIAGCTSNSWYTHSSTSELCTLPSKNNVCIINTRAGQHRMLARSWAGLHSTVAESCQRLTFPNGPTSMRSTSWYWLLPEYSTCLTRIDHFRSSPRSSSSCTARQYVAKLRWNADEVVEHVET